MRNIELSDGVVTLSPLTLDDVDAHLAGEDGLLVRWLNGEPSTRASTEEYVRHCQEQWADKGTLRAFGVRAGDGLTLAGTIDVRLTVPGLAPGAANIAYGLYPAWRGQGLATRAVDLVCRYTATEGARVGVIRVDPANAASEAVARRAGFTYMKQVRETDGTCHNWYVRDLKGLAAPR
ncbi:GNAT family N-acetyltransferase [Streptomyces spectabilis]|uniref:GNAT family N-acetyltransferase n=1 Tax=Streptomyces spectabilis TaxID=68270 RepID=UPI001CEF9D8C|nr:GNAT family protein [Streptomyces spectabilis]